MARAVLLDRDGTIIEDVGYPRHPNQVRLMDGAVDALQRLQHHGFMLVIISNQSGIGRGWVSQLEADRVHDRVIAMLSEKGVQIRGAYYCPHAPDAECQCRKPATGLLQLAAHELGLDLARCVMIGDKVSDIEAGKIAGCRTVLFGTEKTPSVPACQPDMVARVWSDVVDSIIAKDSPQR